MPLFSIILPCRDVAEHLPVALAHLKSEADQNWEVICVNDGSTDQTLSVAMRAAQLDQRVRVIHQTRAGVDHACRTGLTAALGKWVVFLTPQMMREPESLAVFLKGVQTHPWAGALRLTGAKLLGTCFRRDLMLNCDGFHIAGDESLAVDVALQISAKHAPVVALKTTQPRRSPRAPVRVQLHPTYEALAA